MGSGTNVYIAAGNYLSAIVHALDSTGRFKVISRPMVFTSNNKKAIIASGTEIPVPSNTISSPTGSGILTGGISQSTTIEFKKVALQLEVVPLINSEKEVSLDILQKVDSLAGTTMIDGNAIPNIATRYIRTTVSVAERRHDCSGWTDHGQQPRQSNWNTNSRSAPGGGSSFSEHQQNQKPNRADRFDAARSFPDEIRLVSTASKEPGANPFRP